MWEHKENRRERKVRKNFNILLYTLRYCLIHLHQECFHVESEVVVAMFISALFAIAKRWMQPKCPPIVERINKTRCVHTRHGTLLGL